MDTGRGGDLRKCPKMLIFDANRIFIMQIGTDKLITQVMSHHTPTRGLLSLKTPQVYFL